MSKATRWDLYRVRRMEKIVTHGNANSATKHQLPTLSQVCLEGFEEGEKVESLSTSRRESIFDLLGVNGIVLNIRNNIQRLEREFERGRGREWGSKVKEKST